MPSVLTHINLANDILRLNSNLDKYKFIIGTIMPDCIDFSDYKEYKSSHYIGDVQCLRLPKSLHGRG